MPYCTNCGSYHQPEHPSTDVCEECWDEEMDEEGEEFDCCDYDPRPSELEDR